jgi:hypothetical protein
MECEEGYCYYQCCCDCKGKCDCEHKTHIYGYCPTDCCELVKCRNYSLCLCKSPQWFLTCHGGLCYDCACQMGPHEMTNLVDKCPVCLNEKIMIKLQCAHTICNSCWVENTLDDENWSNKCPICRSVNSYA